MRNYWYASLYHFMPRRTPWYFFNKRCIHILSLNPLSQTICRTLDPHTRRTEQWNAIPKISLSLEFPLGRRRINFTSPLNSFVEFDSWNDLVVHLPSLSQTLNEQISWSLVQLLAAHRKHLIQSLQVLSGKVLGCWNCGNTHKIEWNFCSIVSNNFNGLLPPSREPFPE